MSDFKTGIKKEIAEVKFLIHDLRVGRSINEIIHFHGALDTDLEIYGVDQAQAMHGEDLAELKRQGLSLRKAEKDYQNAVRELLARLGGPARREALHPQDPGDLRADPEPAVGPDRQGALVPARGHALRPGSQPLPEPHPVDRGRPLAYRALHRRDAEQGPHRPVRRRLGDRGLHAQRASTATWRRRSRGRDRDQPRAARPRR